MVVRNYKYKIKKKTGKINGNIVDLITCKVIEPEKKSWLYNWSYHI